MHRLQDGPLRRKQTSFYRELTVKLGDGHVVMLRGEGAIDDKQVAVIETNVQHAVALSAQEKVLARWAIRYSLRSSSCSA